MNKEQETRDKRRESANAVDAHPREGTNFRVRYSAYLSQSYAEVTLQPAQESPGSEDGLIGGRVYGAVT